MLATNPANMRSPRFLTAASVVYAHSALASMSGYYIRPKMVGAIMFLPPDITAFVGVYDGPGAAYGGCAL